MNLLNMYESIKAPNLTNLDYAQFYYKHPFFDDKVLLFFFEEIR